VTSTLAQVATCPPPQRFREKQVLNIAHFCAAHCISTTIILLGATARFDLWYRLMQIFLYYCPWMEYQSVAGSWTTRNVTLICGHISMLPRMIRTFHMSIRVVRDRVTVWPCLFLSSVTRLRAGRPEFDSRHGLGFFPPRHRVQTGSGAHPVSYSMGKEGSFHGGKAAGVWIRPLTSI
jgi:hypothetical protein